ncbi:MULTISPECIES: LysM peptidoglycan-binding domain-containing protein [Pseudomonas]|uniref:LysM peptidoglycan-binding domain-containing protein n=1 Tax=Pseudomonas TaxID=286 RepID=UPI0018E68CAC|nr:MULTISPECIES: LysM domain-containing protein [Pseudomonas]MBI6946913.1 LysM peptidoglycan-binding domain-containing protein [Pseudomonas koreensis]MCU7213709.1 LysM peptidoglycan-binding domain-containing protein [Pseudomonas sp. VE 196-7]
MEITNHAVMPGETLSQIASRYNSTVAQLRQLNPFITNPNNVKVGWNLSVPKSAQAASATPAASTPAAPKAPAETAPNAATQCSAEDLVELDPVKDSPDGSSKTFKPHAPPCSKTFASAIYATEEQEFWLLPERAKSAIKESMFALEKMIAPNKARDARLNGLQESGLLEYFLEPKLSNFLTGAQRTRMEEFEAMGDEIEIDPATAKKRQNEANRNKPVAAPAQAPQEDTAQSRIDRLNADIATQQSIRKEFVDFHKRRTEWLELKKEAIKAAKLQGYSYESGSLYSKEAIEARARVQAYLEARKKILSNKDFKQVPLEDVAKALAEQKKSYESICSGMSDCTADMSGYVYTLIKNADALNYHAYTESIIKVSEYGIALPEFALISDGLPSGIAQFKLYLDTEKKQAEVTAQLQEKYKRWIEATGQNAQAPAGLVDVERAEWDRLQKIKDDLQATAQSNVNATKPGRHLIWEPEEFQPKPVDRMVKPGFPLREVSLSDAKGTPLGWFSMTNLKDAKKILKEDGKSLGGSLKKVMKSPPTDATEDSDKNSETSSFREWLLAQGAVKFSDQVGDCFDEKGWFKANDFYAYLKKQGYTVTELENSAALTSWGKHLQQLVFRKSVRGKIRLFDNSPQAQFVRCLTPPQPSIHGEVKLEGPKMSAAEGFQMSANVGLSLDLARGEVQLMKIDMPAKASAKDITLDYSLDGVPQKMSFGRFSFHFGVKAWGYAGASLLLAGTVELSPILGNVKYGASLSPVKRAQREDASAKEERADHDAAKKAKADSGDNSPTPDLEHKSKSGTVASTKSTDQVLTGRAANVQIENGAKATFNVFGGLQAAIELTGALNWAPPKELVALRTAPTMGIGSDKDAKKANPWLTLAKLSGSVGVALGAGFQGTAQISVDKGRFILNLKAAVVLGPGANGSFKFEIGYEAVVDIINLYRKELHKAKGRKIEWMEPEAGKYASALNVLGAAGLNVEMAYLMGWDVVMSLYETMTSSGKGGPIAHAIVEYQNPDELKKWVIEATPEALGPILMTLMSNPEEFTIASTKQGTIGTSKEGNKKYTRQQSYLAQQTAIEIIITYITTNAKNNGSLLEAQKQFELACACMNKFGVQPVDIGQKYCENRYLLDNFMSEPVLNLIDALGNTMRARYKKNASLLGEPFDGSCKIVMHENSYIPKSSVRYSAPASKLN